MIEYCRRSASRGSRANWLLLPLLLAAATVFAAEGENQPSNALRGLDYSVLPGNRLELRLNLEQAVERPRTFSIREPARIAVDLPDTANRTGKRSIPVDVGVTSSVDIAEARGRTRVILNLSEVPQYRTRSEGKSIVITLGTQPGEGASSEVADAAATQDQAAETDAAAAAEESAETAAADQGQPGKPFEGQEGDANAASGRTVEDIRFRRGAQGEGRVVVDLANPDMPVNISRKGGEIVLDLPGSTIPKDLRRRLDVLDFATPVQFVDISQRGEDGQVRIVPRTEDYEQLAYQSDAQMTVELKPLTEREIEEKEQQKPQYTGERLSLNFQDIEVRSVLQLLADFTGLNVVVSDSVGGSLTLRLKNVPWDQALDIILQTEGLGKRRNGNVIFVAPQQEIAQREQQQLEAEQKREELAPLRTEFIQVNYAKASELAGIMQSGGASMLSDRGNVTVDQRTNTLLVRDTAENLEQARRLVTRLDVPVRQVLIESRIVVANDNFNREIGAKFAYTHGSDSDEIGVSGTAQGASDAINTSTEEQQGGSQVDSISNASGDFNVNLPAAGGGSFGLALADLPFGTLLELELSALEAEGRGEIISTPRVITSNQSEAVIEQGVEIPFQEATSSGATSVSFEEAVLSLNVTPQITPDDRVIMDLEVTRDSVGQVFQGVPSIDTRAVQTQVLVDNGDTVVLGGIYEKDKNESVTRVPFFGDLPLVGNLFRNKVSDTSKNELLIFVTPKIVKDRQGLNY